MDILKAEIAKKRKLLEDRKLVDEKKKYFKRGDLIEEEKKEYLAQYGPKLLPHQENISGASQTSRTDEVANSITELPRGEVIRKLRERGEPITLFGESEHHSCKRLRQLEISAPEVNKGFRNDFQEAMEEVDQDYLNEILASDGQMGTKDKKAEDDWDLPDTITYESIQEMAQELGRGNRDIDLTVIRNLLEFLLKMWHDQLYMTSTQSKASTKSKIARATYTQTNVYLKPLLRKLKNKSIPEDILDSLIDITKCLLQRNYLRASDAYLTMAIGNAPWPIGVTMVGIHARTGREKIFSKNVAHVMNDETQRKYIQALKRLMTKCQEYFPTDPSKCVEYVSKKDLPVETE